MSHNITLFWYDNLKFESGLNLNNLLLLKLQPTQAQWRKVFYIAAGVYIFCASFYNVFGAGHRQEWDNPAEDAALAEVAAEKKARKIEKKSEKDAAKSNAESVQ